MKNPKQKIVILDYGVGNIFNLKRAFDLFSDTVLISKEPEDISAADKLILPGVGAFQHGMDCLTKANLDLAIPEFVHSGKFIMGVCLGMQLLLESSEENGQHQGLGFIPGRVIRFEPAPKQETYKVPQIAWNTINPASSEIEWGNTILQSLKPHAYMYFVHSYLCAPSNAEHELATTEYGHKVFCSVLRKDNIYGCQFHPELSGQIGLKIIENFIKL